MRLDHLAIACRDLWAGCDWAQAALGVPFGPGGRHARFGTHNRLLGLGPDLYLEVIAPDPDAAPFEGPRWFGLDTPPPVPRGWATAGASNSGLRISRPRPGRQAGAPGPRRLWRAHTWHFGCCEISDSDKRRLIQRWRTYNLVTHSCKRYI